MKKPGRYLYTVIKYERRVNEDIFILRSSEVDDASGVMHRYNINELFKYYSLCDRVERFWHENGLCIILKD